MSNVTSTTYLALRITPAGDEWFCDPSAFEDRENAAAKKADPSFYLPPVAPGTAIRPKHRASDPTLIKRNGDMIVFYSSFDEEGISLDREVQVRDGVIAYLTEGYPKLEVGDQWMYDPADGAIPSPCRHTLKVVEPPEWPNPVIAKKVTGDGMAMLDQWRLRTEKRASPKVSRELAVWAFKAGQTVANGDLFYKSGLAMLSQIFEPDPEDESGIPSELKKSQKRYYGSLEELTAQFNEGYKRPCNPFGEMLPAINPPPPKRWKLGDDAELGQHMAVKLGGNAADRRKTEGQDLTAIFDRGAIHKASVWGVWEQVPEHLANQIAAKYSGSLVAKPTLKDPMAVQPVLLSQHRIVSIRKVAEMYLTSPAFFDKAPDGVAFQGSQGPLFLPVDVDRGVAGDVVPLEPGHRVRETQVLPISYDSEAKCPMFADFLDSVFAGLSDEERSGRQTCLLQFFGAALLGIGPKFAKALILTGEGANGKSTLLKIMAQLFPSEARVAIPMHAFGEDYKRSMFANARINLCNELPGREVLDGDAVKDIITGEEVTARLPYLPPFQFSSRAAHVFACNRLPATNDLSSGFFRRFVVLDFPNSFVGREDRDLADRIIKAELPGILNLVLLSARTLVEQGHYTIPDSARTAEQTWRQVSDSAAGWLHEATDPNGWTGSAVAHTAYKVWCERVLLKPKSQREFSQRLDLMKVPSKVVSGAKFWGLTPRQDLSVLFVDENIPS